MQNLAQVPVMIAVLGTDTSDAVIRGWPTVLLRLGSQTTAGKHE
jgi:hypothetical protein